MVMGLDVDGGTRAASQFNGSSGIHYDRSGVSLDGTKTTETASSQLFIKKLISNTASAQ